MIFQNFIPAFSQFHFFMSHFRVGQKNPQSPLQQSFADIKKTYAIDCLNEQFILRRSFHMEVTTRFELVNEGFADLCLTTMIVVSPSFSELLRVSRMHLLHSTSTRLPTGISPPLGDIIIAHTPLSLQHSRILGRALFLGCSHFSFLYTT